MQTRLETLNWNVPARFRLCLVELAAPSDTFLTFYQVLLAQSVSGADSLIYRDSVVIIVDTSMAGNGDSRLRNTLEAVCRDNNLRCAISEEVSSLVDLRQTYLHASRTLQMSSKRHLSESVFQYEEFLIHFMIEFLASSGQAQQFVHPTAKRVREYDRVNGTDYEKTLCTYLAHAKDPVRTFTELHIHRNTLSYRLRRLSELFAVNWDNGALLSHLQRVSRLLDVRLHRFGYSPCCSGFGGVFAPHLRCPRSGVGRLLRWHG